MKKFSHPCITFVETPVKDEHLSFQQSVRTDDLFKNMLSYVGVNCAQRVVQEIDVRCGEDSASQTYSLLLSTAQVDALKQKAS